VSSALKRLFIGNSASRHNWPSLNPLWFRLAGNTHCPPVDGGDALFFLGHDCIPIRVQWIFKYPPPNTCYPCKRYIPIPFNHCVCICWYFSRVKLALHKPITIGARLAYLVCSRWEYFRSTILRVATAEQAPRLCVVKLITAERASIEGQEIHNKNQRRPINQKGDKESDRRDQ